MNVKENEVLGEENERTLNEPSTNFPQKLF